MSDSQNFLPNLMDMGSILGTILRATLNYKRVPMSTINGPLVKQILTVAHIPKQAFKRSHSPTGLLLAQLSRNLEILWLLSCFRVGGFSMKRVGDQYRPHHATSHIFWEPPEPDFWKRRVCVTVCFYQGKYFARTLPCIHDPTCVPSQFSPLFCLRCF